MAKQKTVIKEKAVETSDFISEGAEWLSKVLFDGPAKTKKVTKETKEEPEEDDGDEDEDEDEDELPKAKPNARPNGNRAGSARTAASAPVNINISGLFREPGGRGKPVVKRKPPTPPAEDDTEGEAEGEQE
jgi:hypothetical protein